MIDKGRYLDPELIRIKTPSFRKDGGVASKLKEVSRFKYGKDKKTVEEEIRNRILRSNEVGRS